MPSGAETRQRILDAAVEVVRTQGLTDATTKEIALAAGLTEGALYKHFPDKFTLLREALLGCVPGPDDLVDIGPGESSSLQAGLEQVALQALRYLLDLGAIAMSLDADPKLQAALRESLSERGIGALVFHRRLRDWIRGHPEGRMLSEEVADTLTYLLFGACNEYSLIARLEGADQLPPQVEFARRIAQAVMAVATSPPARSRRPAPPTKRKPPARDAKPK